MNYRQILQIGDKLKERNSGPYMSRTKLVVLLRDMSKCHTTPTLRHYADILKKEGYIRATNNGDWEILK